MNLLQQFCLGFGASFGFAHLFHCPKHARVLSSFAGGVGWLVYYVSMHYLHHRLIVATFLAGIVLSVLCEILARIKKDAVTVFVIPAILPLVPGGSLYYTLLYFIESNYDMASSKLLETIGCACSIAIAILFVSSFASFISKFFMMRRKEQHG